eukprot:1543304-Pyramimonas_sp.AAC.1
MLGQSVAHVGRLAEGLSRLRLADPVPLVGVAQLLLRLVDVSGPLLVIAAQLARGGAMVVEQMVALVAEVPVL